MISTASDDAIDLTRPIKLTSKQFINNKYTHYQRMLEEAPVWRAKIAFMNCFLIPRYEDCMSLLKDPRFVRNRATATGGSRMPFPIPRSLRFMAESMIVSDGEDHRRLRGLVNKGFSPKAIEKFSLRIESLANELLDDIERKGEVDLQPSYCLPIPTRVIAEMVGVRQEQMPVFMNSMRVLSNGLSGWSLLRTIAWDLRKVVGFFEALIAEKREHPADDILSELIAAEEDGERLTQDELIATVFLLIVAGFETTTHLISNGVLSLLKHPDQLERLRAEPELIDSAVEEMQRYRGPIHGTKPYYALEDMNLHGVDIKKGAMCMPCLGAANHDPSVFDKPGNFDIARTPNRHLGFGHGAHFCLGAQLARLETKIAIQTLITRNPNLRLAVAPEEIKLQNMPLWHRHDRLPVALG